MRIFSVLYRFLPPVKPELLSPQARPQQCDARIPLLTAASGFGYDTCKRKAAVTLKKQAHQPALKPRRKERHERQLRVSVMGGARLPCFCNK